MHTEFDDLRDAARDALHALEREREQMEEMTRRIEAFYRMTDQVKDILAENDALKQKREKLEQEIEQLHDRLAKKKATFPEVHNHFEAGSSAQIFNDKVVGKFNS